MRSLSANLSLVVTLLVLVGMIPCLGWVQWFGAVIAGVAIVVGGLGLLVDKPEAKTAHIVALVVGILGGGVGALRLCLGAGIL